MDFQWSAEQLALRDATIAFGEGELQDDVIARDQEERFSQALWKKCATFGVQGLPFAEKLGGGDRDILTTALVMQSLGYACKDNGLLFALAAQLWSVQMPLARFGTEAQKRKYLPGLCAGNVVGANAVSESDAGSDAFALRTTAKRRGAVYVLNGRKTWVSEAPIADLFVIFATAARSRGVLGITAFLVERGSRGLSVGKPIHKMGLRTSPMAELALEDCVVPEENRLGREGKGGTILNDSMEWERGLIMASCLGTMQRQLKTCVRFAKERQQFGRPISDNQSIANRLAQMKLRLEAGQLLLYRCAWLKQNDCAANAEAAMAKLFVSEAFVQSSLDAIQILGASGYTTDVEAERDLRDAIGSRLYSGTNEIQLNLIARSLVFR